MAVKELPRKYDAKCFSSVLLRLFYDYLLWTTIHSECFAAFMIWFLKWSIIAFHLQFTETKKKNYSVTNNFSWKVLYSIICYWQHHKTQESRLLTLFISARQSLIYYKWEGCEKISPMPRHLHITFELFAVVFAKFAFSFTRVKIIAVCCFLFYNNNKSNIFFSR